MAADDRIDALFAGPAEEFVVARDALVKQLKAEGDKDLAAEVKALRRPTVAAWAVNQVARTAKQDVARLVQIGDRLRDAHDALLEGKGDGAIREITAERRKLVAELTKQAVGLLGAGGDAQAEAITHTFDAAVADPDAGMAVRAGRLSKELEAPSGFGGGLVFGSSEPAPPRQRRDKRRPVRPTSPTETADATASEDDAEVDAAAPAQAEAEAEAKQAAIAAEAAAKEAERRRHELRREAEERAAEAEQATREAAAARQEVSRLQDLLATATARAEAAAERAELAQRSASTAQRALDETSDAE